MQNILKQFVVVLSALLFYSCDDNSSVEPDPTPEEHCRVVAMNFVDERIKIFYNDDFKTDSLFHYEGDKLVRLTKIEYSGANTIDIYTKHWQDFDGIELIGDFHTRLEFNEEGKLVKESYFDDESGFPPIAVEPYIHDYDTLIYNGSGKLVEVQHWNKEGDPDNDYILYSISSVVMDDNFNIVSVNYKDLKWDEEINYQYTYDNKKRVSEDPALLNLLFSGGDHADGEYLSQNNVLTETSDDGEKYNYSYTYNEEGRPVGVVQFGETVVVSYEGCN